MVLKINLSLYPFIRGIRGILAIKEIRETEESQVYWVHLGPLGDQAWW